MDISMLDIAINPIYYYSETTRYCQGVFLGKGGYGRCYKVTNTNGESFALKEIKLITKGYDLSNLIMKELQIQSKLEHENIVKLFEFFKDDVKVCIVLELCPNHTLYQLWKRRSRVTEPECRYFMKHILTGCQYLHSNGYIHRDLKLDNLLFDKEMKVKIADFGLSAKVKEDKLNSSVCGTVVYMAPEMLAKSHYNCSVDMWSVGCIIYNLLFGTHPFPNNGNEFFTCYSFSYTLPKDLTPSTKEIIHSLLEKIPSKRISASDALELDYFTEFIPDSLPTSVLSMPPRFDGLVNKDKSIAEDLTKTIYYNPSPFSHLLNSVEDVDEIYRNEHLKALADQLHSLLESSPVLESTETEKSKLLDLMSDSKDPSLEPIYWISKWVDFANAFGLGYKLTDASTGVFFTNKTCMVMTENQQNIQFIDDEKTEYLFTNENLPEKLFKRREILKYVENYMQINLATAGQRLVNVERESMVRLPYLEAFLRTSEYIALYLSNGTFQINFLEDHAKLVLCPLMEALTYIQSPDVYVTFKMQHMKSNGMIQDIHDKLKFCLKKLKYL